MGPLPMSPKEDSTCGVQSCHEAHAQKEALGIANLFRMNQETVDRNNHASYRTCIPLGHTLNFLHNEGRMVWGLCSDILARYNLRLSHIHHMVDLVVYRMVQLRIVCLQVSHHDGKDIPLLASPFEQPPSLRKQRRKEIESSFSNFTRSEEIRTQIGDIA
mmetsp:Transcript_12885/g.19973  ORF Transcript_12885/g.19973 Transcript_12885/m.19973 type:complete len:160 (-) Transcript_12885:83-562(-)